MLNILLLFISLSFTKDRCTITYENILSNPVETFKKVAREKDSDGIDPLLNPNVGFNEFNDKLLASKYNYSEALRKSSNPLSDPAVKQALQKYIQTLKEIGKYKVESVLKELARMKAIYRKNFSLLGSIQNKINNAFLTDSKIKQIANELKTIDAELRKYDHRQPEFRKLAQKKIKILKEYFGNSNEIKEYIKAYESLFSLSELSTSGILPVVATTPLEKEILFDHGIAASFYRLPGSTEKKVADGRKSLSEINNPLKSLELDTEKKISILPDGNIKLFLASETFALWRRADLDAKLSDTENALADAYENTVSILREKPHSITGKSKNETGDLGLLVSITSEERMPNQNELSADSSNSYYNAKLGRWITAKRLQALKGDSPVVILPPDSTQSSGYQEFVKDRYRYLANSAAEEPQKYSLKDWVELSLDVREAQANSHWVDQWWIGERRATKNFKTSLDGRRDVKIEFKKGDVVNEAWENTYGDHKGFYVRKDNVPNGGITDKLINGEGFYGKDGLIIQTGKSNTNISRMFDPAQRETLTRGKISGEIPKRTTGWQQVAEVPIEESGNSFFKPYIRRVFWNEALVDGFSRSSETKPGQLGRGEFRIGQQSLPLEAVLGTLDQKDPLFIQTTNYLQKKHSQIMPLELAKKLQKQFGSRGEIDRVRGEIVVNIEGLVEKEGVTIPFQWTWDNQNQKWVANEYTQKSKQNEKEDKKPEDHIIFNCKKCHVGGHSVARLNGRCVMSLRSDGFFDAPAKSVLTKDRLRLDSPIKEQR
jgi:hypothetical protein